MSKKELTPKKISTKYILLKVKFILGQCKWTDCTLRFEYPTCDVIHQRSAGDIR